MVRNGCGYPGHKVNGADFLHGDANSGKLRITLIIFG